MNIFSTIFLILGGLALFLYGLFILSSGFKKISSQKLREVLERLTKNPIRGAGLGALITSIIQSSSIMVVTLIGLLNAGLLSLRQAIGVMLGAEIGTTITAQIVAFKVGIYYFPLIALGFALLFFCKKRSIQYIGQIILGFGILFLGMSTITQGVGAIKEIPFFINMLATFGQVAVLGILAGALFTAIIQSSSATMALIIAMGMGGVIGLPSAIALMLGANIGTCITGFLASIRSSKSSKRLSAAQLTVNILGVSIFALLIGPFGRIVALTSQDLGRQLANAHTIFNLIITLAAIPLVGFLVVLVKKIIPGKEIRIEKGAKFLDNKILSLPSIAILQAQKEVIRMARITQEMLRDGRKGLLKGDKESLRSVIEKEPGIDELHHFIDTYVTRISSLNLSEKDSKKVTLLIHSVTDIERVADHANNLVELSEFKVKKNIEFSDIARQELERMFEKVIESFSQAILALENNDKKIAQRVLEIEREVNRLDEELQRSHYKRLEEGICKPEAGPVYLEIVSNLERISDHSENIAGGVITGF